MEEGYSTQYIVKYGEFSCLCLDYKTDFRWLNSLMGRERETLNFVLSVVNYFFFFWEYPYFLKISLTVLFFFTL